MILCSAEHVSISCLCRL